MSAQVSEFDERAVVAAGEGAAQAWSVTLDRVNGQLLRAERLDAGMADTLELQFDLDATTGEMKNVRAAADDGTHGEVSEADALALLSTYAAHAGGPVTPLGAYVSLVGSALAFWVSYYQQLALLSNYMRPGQSAGMSPHEQAYYRSVAVRLTTHD